MVLKWNEHMTLPKIIFFSVKRYVQSPSHAYKRFWFYAMKMGYLKFNFHTLVMLQFVWAPGSKQTLIRPFQKCTVHVCSLNDSKVMKCQSSQPPQKMRLRCSERMNTLCYFIANTSWRRCLWIFDIFLFIQRPTTFIKIVLLKSFVFPR